MSPRPGRIVDIVDVPLERPRASAVDDATGSVEFAQITADLWKRLRDMQVGTRRSRAGSSPVEAVA
jgi:hypothetical protein